MGVIICSFWCDLGSPLLGKGGTSWLVSFVGKKCKKSLEAGSFMSFLDGVEGKKHDSF